jgi:ADP-heptose:LPS heptosyltransferase
LLRRESFDELWSLDVDPFAAAWTPDLNAREKRGFSYQDGALRPLGEAARGWLELSLRDDLKRANRRTYQDWMFEACGLRWEDRFRPLWRLTDEERAWASGRLKAWKVPPGARRLGVNTGAGGRWAQKKWTEEGLAGLLAGLKREKGLRVLLLGGPEERERNRRLKRRFPWAVDTGCDNPLRRFAALVGACDAVVTGDTMALHLAVALGRRVVVLFGPTSSAEIELHGRGEKLHKDWDCLPCYRAECLRSPNCMEALGADEVLASVRRQLSAAAV